MNWFNLPFPERPINTAPHTADTSVFTSITASLRRSAITQQILLPSLMSRQNHRPNASKRWSSPRNDMSLPVFSTKMSFGPSAKRKTEARFTGLHKAELVSFAQVFPTSGGFHLPSPFGLHFCILRNDLLPSQGPAVQSPLRALASSESKFASKFNFVSQRTLRPGRFTL